MLSHQGLLAAAEPSSWTSLPQMIKFYAWEESFRTAVQAPRSQEAGIMRRTAVWQVRRPGARGPWSDSG